MAEEEKVAVTEEEKIAKAKADAKAEAIAELEETYKKKFNETSAAERKSYEKKLADSKLSQEELIKKEREDEFNRLTEENKALKGEKSKMLREQVITKNQLPNHYLNDVRLLNAKDEELPEIAKTLQKEHTEYVKELTKGSVGNTAPKSTQVGTANQGKDPILAKYGIKQQ